MRSSLTNVSTHGYSNIDRLFGSLESDNRGTNERLGFVPPYSSEDGIRETVEWYKKSRGWEAKILKFNF